jgi:hypothetical protein
LDVHNWINWFNGMKTFLMSLQKVFWISTFVSFGILQMWCWVRFRIRHVLFIVFRIMYWSCKIKWKISQFILIFLKFNFITCLYNLDGKVIQQLLKFKVDISIMFLFRKNIKKQLSVNYFDTDDSFPNFESKVG